MKIWCKNYNCSENKKLDHPVQVNLRRFYIPIGKEDNLYSGECQSKILNIVPVGLLDDNVRYSVALCVPTKEKNVDMFVCGRGDCAFSKDKKCLKDEIIIDKLIVDNLMYWICKNFSQTKISGHRDLMQLVDSEGHPKFGGHLSDQDAEKMYKESLKFKSFPGGLHREAKEPKRKKNV